MLPQSLLDCDGLALITDAVRVAAGGGDHPLVDRRVEVVDVG
ncbi:MAG: hypothetical protein ACR2HE_09920 [Casimicrobiaceae bacterium]